jgi:signal peptidase I
MRDDDDRRDDDGRRSDRDRGRSTGRFLRDLVIIVVVALLASFLVKAYLVRSFYIPSESMENTLLVGDRVLVNELVPKTMRLERGDVVVFRDPNAWLSPGQGAEGRLSVNGHAVDEPYVELPADVKRVSGDDFAVTVPAGRIWVMGDNRYNSADSRIHGNVPLDDVVGRAFVITWPADRWSVLSRYGDEWDAVPDPK